MKTYCIIVVVLLVAVVESPAEAFLLEDAASYVLDANRFLDNSERRGEQLIIATFSSAFDSTFAGLEEARKQVVESIKDMAISLKNFTTNALKIQYNRAKSAFEKLIHSKAFSKLVNMVIPLIADTSTVHHCSVGCAAVGHSFHNVLPEGLAPFVCPHICKGALAKVREAAEIIAGNAQESRVVAAVQGK